MTYGESERSAPFLLEADERVFGDLLIDVDVPSSDEAQIHSQIHCWQWLLCVAMCSCTSFPF